MSEVKQNQLEMLADEFVETVEKVTESDFTSKEWMDLREEFLHILNIKFNFPGN